MTQEIIMVDGILLDLRIVKNIVVNLICNFIHKNYKEIIRQKCNYDDSIKIIIIFMTIIVHSLF